MTLAASPELRERELAIFCCLRAASIGFAIGNLLTPAG
jgi:hypothetical protein